MTTVQLLDENLIAKIKGMQIRAKYLVNDVFAGEYTSAFKGRGIEFEEVREYLPGDDVRNIDWNVTARSNRPFIKLYRDERELTVMFVVDVSASSRFGTLKKFKNEIAAEITALLAYTALRSNDKVGMIIFSDDVEHYLPPKKGRGHVWRLIRDILSYQSKSRETNFKAPLDFLNRVVQRKSVVFLISDFQDTRFDTELRATSRHHDLIGISIHDPREIALPPIGYVEFEDAETGEFVLINTNDTKFRNQFEASARQSLKEREAFFRSAGVDFIQIDTVSNYIDPLVRFFRKREKMR